MTFNLDKHLPSKEILTEKIAFQSTIIAGVCYGIETSLCFSCLHLLSSKTQSLRGLSSSGTVRSKGWLRIYVALTFVLSTITMWMHAKVAETAFVHHSDQLGEPAAFLVEDISILKTVESVCFVLLQWAADGLLVWRFLAFFSFSQPSLAISVKIIISILAATNIGTSALFVLRVASPQSLTESAGNALVLFYGFYTMFLNAVFTFLIVMKILLIRRRLEKLLGSGQGREYLGIVSILVESAGVIVAYDLFFLVPATIGHPLSIIGREIGVIVQMIPPLMIIQRVGRGTAWSSQRSADLEEQLSASSRLEFARDCSTTIDHATSSTP